MSQTNDTPQGNRRANLSTYRKLGRWCRQIYYQINDSKPRITEEDDDGRRWNEKARCGRLQLLSPLFVAILFLTDVGLDCKIAVTHFAQGDLRWGAYTLCVVIFSLIITDVLSASLYFADQVDLNKTEWLTRNNLQVRPWFYVFHLIFCGRLLRCFQIFKTVRIVRATETAHPDNTQLYRIYISQLYQLSIVGVVEAFTEEAPQVALQLYILLQKGALDWTDFAGDAIVGINIIKSLSLFSFSLLNFYRYNRLKEEDSNLLNLFSWGSVLNFTWRLFMLIARILALVLFAIRFKHYVFIIVAIHLLFSLVLIHGQPDNYFREGSLRDKLLRFAFSCINTFCFFPLAGEKTRRWALPYYVVTFIENSVLVLLWYFYSDIGQVFKIVMAATAWGSFLLGSVSVLLFYGVFHPSKRNSRNVETAAAEETNDGTIRTILQLESVV